MRRRRLGLSVHAVVLTLPHLPPVPVRLFIIPPVVHFSLRGRHRLVGLHRCRGCELLLRVARRGDAMCQISRKAWHVGLWAHADATLAVASRLGRSELRMVLDGRCMCARQSTRHRGRGPRRGRRRLLLGMQLRWRLRLLLLGNGESDRGHPLGMRAGRVAKADRNIRRLACGCGYRGGRR